MQTLTEMGEVPFLLDLSEFPVRAAVSLQFGANGQSGRRFRDRRDRVLNLDSVRAVWWRRPQPFRLESAVQDPAHQMFAVNECREALSGLWRSLDAFWINEPLLDEAAHRKTYQLAVAESLGLPIPDTLVTNDPRAAREFVHRREPGQTVFKCFTGTPIAWRETRMVTSEELENLELVRIAPVIFQEYVPGVDVRVTVVGERIFAAEMDVSDAEYPVDFRMNLNRARPNETSLPPEIVEGIHRLMGRLGLVYGALDFRRRADGEHLFLEINPAGQWLFVEEATGQPITRALAEQLAAGG